ncbi:MAG: RidA family protein [Hyphomicrobium sp.]|uniref:RidA family protein n=1 Tax=Hyphomicrobium sp. TaxID=82 RepID=UPI0039E6E226
MSANNATSALQFFMVPNAPEPVATFSHAVEAGNFVHVTGQMPTYPGEPERPIPTGIEQQTHRVMTNLQVVLTGLGLDWSSVVRAGAYLTHFEEDYARFNEIYSSYFPADRLPARTCIGVTALARGARVEVDLVAFRSIRSAER